MNLKCPIATLEKYLAPEDAVLHNNLGISLYDLDRFDEAITFSVRCIGYAKSDTPDLLLSLSSAYRVFAYEATLSRLLRLILFQGSRASVYYRASWFRFANIACRRAVFLDPTIEANITSALKLG